MYRYEDYTMTPEQQAIQQWLSKPAPEPVVCGCLGPKNGNPVCPCRMQWYEKVGDDWYWIKETRTSDGATLKAIKHESISKL